MAPTRAPQLLDGWDVVVMLADYRRCPLGGWMASLALEGSSAGREAHFPDAHAAYHGVLEAVEDLEDEFGVPFATLHTLEGDPLAWERVALEQGFSGCCW